MSEPTQTVDALLAHEGWLRALARRLVGDSGAEDLVQEVWLRAAERPPAHLESPRGWLAQVLRSIHMRQLKRRDAASARERQASNDEALPSTADLTGRVEAQRELAAAVLALGERHRRVLLLHFYEGLSSAEIGRRTGQPSSTVRGQLAAGLAELRSILDRRPGGRESWLAGIAPLALADVGGTGTATLGLGEKLMETTTLWKLGGVIASLILVMGIAGLMLDADGDLPARDDRPTTGANSLIGDLRAAAATAAERITGSTERNLRSPFEFAASGRVLTPTGAPIRAEVSVASTLGAALVGTDSRGEFRLVFAGQRPSLVELSVEASGYCPIVKTVPVDVGADGRIELGTHFLHVAAVLQGRVTDSAGGPIAGADVRLIPRGGAAGQVHPGRAVTATTSSDGSFALEPVPDRAWTVRVDHPLHPTVVVSAPATPAEPAGAPTSITLPAGGSLSGRLVGFDDLTGISVAATREPTDPNRYEPDLTRSATPDRSGAFVLEGLVLGTDYELVAIRTAAPSGPAETISAAVTARAGNAPRVLTPIEKGGE